MHDDRIGARMRPEAKAEKPMPHIHTRIYAIVFDCFPLQLSHAQHSHIRLTLSLMPALTFLTVSLVCPISFPPPTPSQPPTSHPLKRQAKSPGRNGQDGQQGHAQAGQEGPARLYVTRYVWVGLIEVVQRY
jgi:hypothetical protein